MPDDFKVCVICASKYNPVGIAHEADRIMAEVEIEPNHLCLNCGEIVLPIGELVPLYCDSCATQIYKTFKELCH